MVEVFVMPKLGLTMEEGTLVEWLVELGEVVERGQDLCEVETEKLTMVVESPFAGTLLNRVEPGLTVPVGEPIAVIGEESDDASSCVLFSGRDGGAPLLAGESLTSSTGPAPPSSPPMADPASLASPGRGRAASPLARQLATRLGIDIDTVLGTGPDGRITRDDVERATSSGNSPDPRLTPGRPG